jgi:hypothetical protein
MTVRDPALRGPMSSGRIGAIGLDASPGSDRPVQGGYRRASERSPTANLPSTTRPLAWHRTQITVIWKANASPQTTASAHQCWTLAILGKGIALVESTQEYVDIRVSTSSVTSYLPGTCLAIAGQAA